MASVWFDGTRVNDAETATGWVADGVTPAQEVDFKYQGTYSVSATLKANTEAGYYYGSTVQNLSASNGTWLAKIVQTNKDAINGTGMMLRIGNSTSIYYQYLIFSGATSTNTFFNYPAVGGWQIVPVNPNSTAYTRTTSGTPQLTGVTFWELRSNSSTLAKSQNLGMDAIDWIPNGKGLSLTGTSGSFQDYVSYDEGVLTNRYGVVLTKEGILYVTGTLTVGNQNYTTFSDNGKTIIYPYGRFDTNFCGINFNLAHSASTVSLSTISMLGRGFSGSTDTRPNFTLSSSSTTGGTVSISSSSFGTFNTFYLNSKTTILSSSFNNCGTLIQSGATLTTCNFNNFTASATTISNDPSKISYCKFTSDGSNHAIQITNSGTYSFVGNTFSNYSTAVSGTTGNEAIYNTSGGLVTLNVALEDKPSYRNSSGSTTSISNSVAVTFSGLKDNTEVRIMAAGTATELAGIEDATDGTTDNRSFTFSLAVGTLIDYRIHNVLYEIIEVYSYAMPSSTTTLPIQQRKDRWYN